MGARPYLFELPDDSGGSGFYVVRAVFHSDGGLPFGHFGTQLCHRVETDLLPRRVFKVLEERRDTFICFVHTAKICVLEMEIALARKQKF